MDEQVEPVRVRAWRIRSQSGEHSLLMACESPTCAEEVASSARELGGVGGWARLDAQVWGCAHCHSCGELVLEPQGWCASHEAAPCPLHSWSLTRQARDLAAHLVDPIGWEVLEAWAGERGENWESANHALEELRVAELEFSLGLDEGDEPR